MYSTFKTVVRDTKSLVIGLAGILVIGIAVAVLGNTSLFASVAISSSLGLFSKITFLLTLVVSAYQNMPLFGVIMIALTAFFFGLNLALVSYYMRTRVDTLRAGGVISGGVGLFAGLFGAGCSACGPLFAAAFVPFLGGGFLALLPFNGMEISVFGIVLSLVATVFLLRTVRRSQVCVI